jgi:hypothetical protein
MPRSLKTDVAFTQANADIAPGVPAVLSSELHDATDHETTPTGFVAGHGLIGFTLLNEG